MASDDEYDYMSDNFLVECVKEDIRPGLIHSRTQQRSHNIHKRKKVTDEENKQRNRPQKVIEAERREEGLNSAINDGNKGFALLQKMGYKPGQAIGKSGTGRVDPIPIALKSDRGGLGREAAIREIAAEKLARRQRLIAQREKVTSVEDYRARMIQKAAERYIKDDLRKSQKACERLDTAEGYTEPVESWMWLPRQKSADEEEIEGGGEGYDEDDPETPDNTVKKKDKAEEKEEEEEEEDDDEEEQLEEEVEYEPSEKLEMLTLYLRKTYFYCIWCGVQYEDDKDLRDSCPGVTRDEH